MGGGVHIGADGLTRCSFLAKMPAGMVSGSDWDVGAEGDLTAADESDADGHCESRWVCWISMAGCMRPLFSKLDDKGCSVGLNWCHRSCDADEG